MLLNATHLTNYALPVSEYTGFVFSLGLANLFREKYHNWVIRNIVSVSDAFLE